MTKKQKHRLYAAIAITLAALAIVGLVLYALNQNINLFFTPSQLAAGKVPTQQVIRLGGLVKHNSIKKIDGGLTTEFVITDRAADVTVRYTGVLPDLFRDGQGIVVGGRMQQNIFVANQVLAKHDANYMPPPVKSALTQADIQHLEQQGNE
ncbi:MAG: cytochrome c maturation protein CcmE [Gammaproteobacteria bacterium]|nr:cytochrome c maturation protein CcmE [Gammaproteobacteria bacterium]